MKKVFWGVLVLFWCKCTNIARIKVLIYLRSLVLTIFSIVCMLPPLCGPYYNFSHLFSSNSYDMALLAKLISPKWVCDNHLICIWLTAKTSHMVRITTYRPSLPVWQGKQHQLHILYHSEWWLLVAWSIRAWSTLPLQTYFDKSNIVILCKLYFSPVAPEN